MRWRVDVYDGGSAMLPVGVSETCRSSSVSCGKLLHRAAVLKAEVACAIAGNEMVELVKCSTSLAAAPSSSSSSGGNCTGGKSGSSSIFSRISSPASARASCAMLAYGFVDGATDACVCIADENAAVRALLAACSRAKNSDNAAAPRADILSICCFEEAVLRPALYEGGKRLNAALTFSAAVASRLKATTAAATTQTLDAADIVLFASLCCVARGRSADADAFIDAVSVQLPAHLRDAAQALRPPPAPLPDASRRNVLITSALPYVNNVPHLGNIIGCVLSADVYARYCRARGDNVLYVCGTDEYGTATETKAFEMGVSAREICDHFHEVHRDVYEWFQIEFDHFGRTSTMTQTGIAQDIFKACQREDVLLEQTQEQLYSDALGKFLADRYVVGTCPKCSYDDARGDQCDACGSLLNPTELVNPRCKFTGTEPRFVPSQHLFIDLPKLTSRLEEYVREGESRWSFNCNTITKAWLRDGLKPRCITRDLSWGTPVPVPGYEKKVFYVWFDAPIGYISITATIVDDWEQWWRNPKGVELVQFMGKDNVPFHTVIFPSTQIGTGEEWTMMHRISVTEYLNYESGKFSKSRGVGVFGNNARDTGISVDVFRYYLLSMRPETADTVFTWSDLQEKNNTELLANLGNFCNRALKFTQAQFGSAVPQHTAEFKEKADEFGASLVELLRTKYLPSMDKMKLKEALKAVMAISGQGNTFMQDMKPWVLVKENMDGAATVIASLVGLVRILAIITRPFMPGFSEQLRAQAGLSQEEASQLPDALVEAAARPYELVPAGRPIGDPQPMFSKIGNDQVEELRQRYSGQQQDSAAEEAAAAASEKKKEEKKRKKEEKKQKKAAAAAAAAPDGDASSVALTKENSS